MDRIWEQAGAENQHSTTGKLILSLAAPRVNFVRTECLRTAALGAQLDGARKRGLRAY